MDVLIVSKTKMQHGVCVGGVTANGNFVRLLDEHGHHPDDSTNYEIRQVWDITYRKPNNPRSLPHSEDVCVISKRLKVTLNEGIAMITFLDKRKVNIYQGSISNLFEGKLQYTQNGAGFINRDNIPKNSVCFWIADKDITRSDYNDKIRYNYDDGSRRWGYNISYVGFSAPVENIPQGTLIRMSLAHWWCPDDSDVEDRCYLQLSGWYDI